MRLKSWSLAGPGTDRSDTGAQPLCWRPSVPGRGDGVYERPRPSRRRQHGARRVLRNPRPHPSSTRAVRSLVLPGLPGIPAGGGRGGGAGGTEDLGRNIHPS